MAKSLLKNEKELFAAVGDNNLEKVQTVLAGSWFRPRVDINVQNKKGETPLLVAAKYDRPEIVAYLLDNGANIGATDEKGHSALWYCICNNQQKNVARLIDMDKSAIQGDAEIELLTCAINSELPDMVGLLIQKGINPNATDKSGYTAVVFAGMLGQVETLKVLEKNGADFKKTYQHDMSLPHFCVHGIDAYRMMSVMRFLVDKKIDVLKPDGYGRTPLMFAAELGDVEVIDFLLQKGADIHQQDKNGDTAIMYAVRNNQKKAFDKLVQYGAYLTIKNKTGTSPTIITKYEDYIIHKSKAVDGGKNKPADNELSNGKYNPHIQYTDMGIQTIVNHMEADEIVQALKKYKEFFQQIITVGVLVDTFRKLSYNQTKECYNVKQQDMSKRVKKQIEDILRDKRQNGID